MANPGFYFAFGSPSGIETSANAPAPDPLFFTSGVVNGFGPGVIPAVGDKVVNALLLTSVTISGVTYPAFYDMIAHFPNAVVSEVVDQSTSFVPAASNSNTPYILQTPNSLGFYIPSSTPLMFLMQSAAS